MRVGSAEPDALGAEPYRIGLPQAGEWREVLNSDSEFYGGTNQGNGGACIRRRCLA